MAATYLTHGGTGTVGGVLSHSEGLLFTLVGLVGLVRLDGSQSTPNGKSNRKETHLEWYLVKSG